MIQIDFDAWCDERQIHAWREAFRHHLMALGITEPDEATLEREWSDCLADLLYSLSKTRDRLIRETAGGE